MRDAGWSRRVDRSPWASLVLVVLLATAALVVPLRPILLMALLVGYGAQRWRGRSSEALAAIIPAAAILAWGALPQPAGEGGAAWCTDPLSPPAVWRVIEAVVGLAAVGLLVVDRRDSWSSLGARLGTRRNAGLAILGFAVALPAALLGGGLVGAPGVGEAFFGAYRLDLTQPAAFLPAGIFALSNAVAEELAYRGAMRAWLGPSLGIVGANLAQAVVFGLAHSGRDFVGSAAPTAVAMVAAGFVAGVVTRRTGSLSIAVAIHAAADVPLYLYWACATG